VRRVQACKRVEHDTDADARRKLLAALHRAREESTEGVPLDVLHDQVVPLAARPDLEDRNDVRMVDARSKAGLVEEHLDEVFVAREMRMKALDRDEALEAADAREACKEDRSHPAGRELGDELEPIQATCLSFDGDQLAQVRLLTKRRYPVLLHLRRFRTSHVHRRGRFLRSARHGSEPTRRGAPRAPPTA
jgi:hypothetical protein